MQGVGWPGGAPRKVARWRYKMDLMGSLDAHDQGLSGAGAVLDWKWVDLELRQFGFDVHGGCSKCVFIVIEGVGKI